MRRGTKGVEGSVGAGRRCAGRSDVYKAALQNSLRSEPTREFPKSRDRPLVFLACPIGPPKKASLQVQEVPKVWLEIC